MWADKRFKEPWLLNFLINDKTDTKNKVQGLHILKKLMGPGDDGSEVKLVTDGKLSIHGIFTEKAIRDYQNSYHRNEDDTPREWDKCLILARKYRLNHIFNECEHGCKFELVIDDFLFWVTEEGFRLKEDPEYCMDVEIIQKKSKKLWEIWKQEHKHAQTSEYSVGGSINLSQLVNVLEKDSLASFQIDNMENSIKPPDCQESESSSSEMKSNNTEKENSDEDPPILSNDLFDIRRFVISKVDDMILNGISEWQCGYRVPVTSSMNGIEDHFNRSINIEACNISVQVGDSLMDMNMQDNESQIDKKEQCAQVGESLFVDYSGESKTNNQKLSRNQQGDSVANIELPSNIVFHPLFLPDETQPDNSIVPEVPAHPRAPAEVNIVASTQIPNERNIPLPDFPVSPVAVSASQQSLHHKTGIQTRSFVTQTKSSILHQEQTPVPNSELRNIEQEPKQKLCSTTCTEFKTCLETPELDVAHEDKIMSSSKPFMKIASQLSPEDSEERSILSGLAQKVPSSGESMGCNNSVDDDINMESREHERLKKLYSWAVEVLELPHDKNKNVGNKMVIPIKISEIEIHTRNNCNKKLMDTNESVKPVNRSEPLPGCDKVNETIEDVMNPLSKKPARKSKRSKSENVNENILYDEDDWDKQQKSLRQKSAQKSRYNFNKTKSVAENIQGMLSTEKKTKFDSNVLFEKSSRKSFSGKKKRLSTRKKLYSDNMLMCDVPSDNNTRSTLPSVTEERELTQDDIIVLNEKDYELPDRDRGKFFVENIDICEENTDNVEIKTEPAKLVFTYGEKACNDNTMNNVSNSQTESSVTENLKTETANGINLDMLQPVVLLEPLSLGNVKTEIDNNFSIKVSNVSTGIVTSIISISSDIRSESYEEKMLEDESDCNGAVMKNTISMSERNIENNIDDIGIVTDIKPEVIMLGVEAKKRDSAAHNFSTSTGMEIRNLDYVNRELDISPKDISTSSIFPGSVTSSGSRCVNLVESPEVSHEKSVTPIQNLNADGKIDKITKNDTGINCKNSDKVVDKEQISDRLQIIEDIDISSNENETDKNCLIPNTTCSSREISNVKIDFLNSNEAINSLERNEGFTFTNSVAHSSGEITTEVSKGIISSSLPCAQVHCQGNLSNELPTAHSQSEGDSRDDIGTLDSDEDPDEEILYKFQSLFERQEVDEDNFNLLHIDFKDETCKVIQAYFVNV